MRAETRTRWPDRGQRGESGSQAVPLVVRRRHVDPAGSTPTAAARRGHLAQGARCSGILRVGFLSTPGQSGLERLDRAGHHREQGPVRPRPESAATLLDQASLPSEASIFRDEFMEATTDLWEIPPESASRVDHPAPFPVELPERLIHLYTYRGDLVLDPFMGSGTTAVAAVRTERHYVGYDTDPTYVERAKTSGRARERSGSRG